MTQEQMRQYEAVEPGSSTGARALISHQLEWSGRRSKVPLGQPPPSSAESWSTMTRVDRPPTSHQGKSACNPQGGLCG